MTVIIKVLTFKMMLVIINSFELTKPGETNTQNPIEPP